MRDSVESVDSRATDRALIVLACGAVCLFLFVAIRYSGQTILEAHGFRQAQTALTTYWLMQNGFSFAYETPVAGHPWSIPLELPIFQVVVAAVTTWFGGNLDANGRLIAAAFLVACIAPLWSIVRQLGMDRRVWLILVVLMFSGPTYLFWGRAFLIETTALFFALTHVALLLHVVRDPGKSAAGTGLAAVAGILAGTQKATIGLPALAFGAALYAFMHWRSRQPMTIPRAVTFLVAVALPLTATFLWNAYTDAVKGQNALAAQAVVTNAAWTWNFGTLAQRLQPHTWKNLLWDRGLYLNGAGIIGAGLIAGVLIYPTASYLRAYVMVALLLWIMPIMVFTNLFMVHDYYQVGIVVFPLLAIAIAIGAWLPELVRARGLTVGLVILCASLNLWQFRAKELPTMTGDFNRNVVTLGEAVRQRTSPDSPIMVFGLDWSSELPYYAKRRAFAVPPWFNARQLAWTEPERFLDGVKPSAIVVCPGEGAPSEAEVADLRAKDSSLSEVDVVGCRVLFRQPQGSHH